MTKYTFTQQANRRYHITDGQLVWSVQVDENSGGWILPTRASAGYNAMTEPRNGSCLKTNQLNQFLRGNPLYTDTKTRNAATGKRVFVKNRNLGV